jgi:hypothetical protein
MKYGKEEMLKILRKSDYTNPTAIQFLIQRYEEEQDILGLKELFKRIAVASLQQNNLDGFLDFYLMHNGCEKQFADKPSYRYSIIDEDFHAFTGMAAKQSGLIERVRSRMKWGMGKKVRIGVCLEGFSDRQAPIQRYRMLGKHYDKSKYEVHFYSRLSAQSPYFERENYQMVIDELRDNGCWVTHPSDDLRPMKQAEFLSSRIQADGIDVLIFQTVYFVPVFNFLSHLQIALFQASGSHQQPEYARTIDCTDCPKSFVPYQVVDCIPLFTPMAKAWGEPAHKRSDFGIPEDAVVLMTADRGIKYNAVENEQLWKNIHRILTENENVYYIPLGFEGSSDHPRIKCLGFRTDIERFIKMSDVYVDNFMQTARAVMECAYFGVPPVTLKYDIFKEPFDVVHQDLASDFLPNNGLVVEEKDWYVILSRLIRDKEYRMTKGEEVKEFAKRFEPERSVKEYLDALTERFWKKYAM